MRITFVLNCIDRVGGVRVVFEHANELIKRDHDVHIVYPAVNLALLKSLSFRAFARLILASPIRYVANLIGKGRRLQPFETTSSLVRVPVLYPRFVKSVEKSIPDADVIIATAWETADAVNLLSEKKGQKFYFVQSYEIWDVWKNPTCWKLAKQIRSGDETYALAMAEVVPAKKSVRESKEAVDRSYRLPLKKIAISGWLRKLIEDKFGERVEGIVPDGVNFSVFFKEGNRRKEAETNGVTVLMPYWPVKLKGFDDGLDAFVQIRKRHPDTRFAVFGSKLATNAREIRKLPQWIEFHGIESDAQLRALYNEAHIFVFPSWIEGFGLPPLEAVACGCALVTTDAGGLTDYLINRENALLVPIQNPDALARSVCVLIEDGLERRRVADNGYRLIQQFTWEHATNKLEAILEKCKKQAISEPSTARADC